jgi:hypothetical protein
VRSGQRGVAAAHGRGVVVGGEEDLQAAGAGGDGDLSWSWARLVDEDRVVLLAGEGRDAAADVAGQREDLAQGDELAAAVAGGAGEGLEVEVLVAGDEREADAVAVAAGDEGLEDLLGREADAWRRR